SRCSELTKRGCGGHARSLARGAVTRVGRSARLRWDVVQPPPGPPPAGMPPGGMPPGGLPPYGPPPGGIPPYGAPPGGAPPYGQFAPPPAGSYGYVPQSPQP